jgi:E3 ubiquitin-protein ligase ATL6/9/15/31/42/55
MKPRNRKVLVTHSIPPLSSATSSTPSPPTERPLALDSSPVQFQYPSVVVVVVVLVALFAIGCFSNCLRQLSGGPAAESSSRRRQTSRQTTTSNLRKGVDPMTIRALPVYSDCGCAKYQLDCAICLSEFEEREAVKVIPFCKHVFHPVCIDTWLSSHLTCPVCRSTRFLDGGSLGVKQERCDQGVSESGERSTAENCDACNNEVRVVGSFSLGVRRNSSCSSLGDGVVLQRTSSV